jgi:HEAT repeat protein
MAGGVGEGPVFFREPDPATARDILDAIDLFGDPSPNNRERARDRLFDIGYWSVPRLREALRERKGPFKSNSLLVLGRLGDRRAIPDMRDEVKDDPSEWPPSIAALMLGRLKDDGDATIAAFRAALAAGENDKRRVAVCLALAKLHRKRSPDCLSMLEPTLDARSANPFVHHAALLALGFFRSRVVEALPDGSGFQPSRRFREALSDREKDTGMRLSAILAMALAYNNSFHPLFVNAFQRDGDHQVRLAALLALGRNREPATTALIAAALESTSSNGAEERMAAYLLSRRADLLKGDEKSLNALNRAATASRAPEVAAAAVVALGGVDDPRILPLLIAKLGDRTATVRAAAAVAATRLVASEDLKKAREALQRRLQAAETDESAKADMQMAVAEIEKILKDRDDAAKGLTPKARPPVAWLEADAKDLFLVLGRDERQRLFDFVNHRAIQVLGIDDLFEYRPVYDPTEPAEGLGTTGTTGASLRPKRPGVKYTDQYDVRVEFARRPYFVPEQDDPDAPTVPLPREPK